MGRSSRDGLLLSLLTLLFSYSFAVVLLRACWMQGAEKCMQDGDATVCTCNEDLCNSSQRTRSDTSLVIPILVLLPTFIAVILLQWLPPPENFWSGPQVIPGFPWSGPQAQGFPLWPTHHRHAFVIYQPPNVIKYQTADNEDKWYKLVLQQQNETSVNIPTYITYII